MTVSKLTEAQKQMVRVNYTSKSMNITKMAIVLGVSTRTIGRVLEELDLPSPVPRLRGEAYNVIQTLKKFGVEPKELTGIITLYKNGPTREQIVAEAMKMDDGTWNALLDEIITARVATKHNVHVQTAMLNLEEKVNRNVQDNKAGRS